MTMGSVCFCFAHFMFVSMSTYPFRQFQCYATTCGLLYLLVLFSVYDTLLAYMSCSLLAKPTLL